MPPRTALSRFLIYLLLIAGSVVFMVPFLWLIATSLSPAAPGTTTTTTPESTESTPITAAVPASEPGAGEGPRWENYREALSNIGGRSVEMTGRAEGAGEAVQPVMRGEGLDAGASPSPSPSPSAVKIPFARIVGSTLLVCVLGAVGAVLSNAFIAYGFARVEWRGRGLLFALTLATMMIPFPVLMVPLYGVFASLGWTGSLRPLWVPAFFGSAFHIFLMRQFFRTIPRELSEAAVIDGCSEWQIFWRIILPLSKPVLAVVALFHVLWAWNDFLGPLLYLARGDNAETATFALALERYRSELGASWPHLMAASAVFILPVLALFFLMQKTFLRGIVTTGVKG